MVRAGRGQALPPHALAAAHSPGAPAPLPQVGLDAAGKTTILYKLKLGEIVTTIPTIGQCSGAGGHCLGVDMVWLECGGGWAGQEGPIMQHGAAVHTPPLPTRRHPSSTPRTLFHRLQRGDGGVQEHQLHRVGRGRPGQGAAGWAGKSVAAPGSKYTALFRLAWCTTRRSARCGGTTSRTRKA